MIPVTARGLPLVEVIDDHEPGDSLSISIDRGGESQTVEASLGTRRA